jgi:hypothetical protein
MTGPVIVAPPPKPIPRPVRSPRRTGLLPGWLYEIGHSEIIITKRGTRRMIDDIEVDSLEWWLVQQLLPQFDLQHSFGRIYRDKLLWRS